MTLDRFSGVNAGYVLELYERYRQDPQSVDPATREVFESWAPADAVGDGAGRGAPPAELHVIVGAANLAESIRRYGHLAAQLDPLGSAPIGDSTLLAEGARHHRRRPEAPAGLARRRPAGRDARRTPTRRSRSCGASTARPPASTSRTCSCPRSARGCARPPSRAATCRRWIRESTPKRCSIASPRWKCSSASCSAPSPARRASRSKGSTCWCPMLDEIMVGAAGTGTRHMMLGMAHRGRLNVLAHILRQAVRADPGRVQGSDRACRCCGWISAGWAT